ncbi:hypothetical protein GCM10011402_37630 [Paracoccus acridae]|uniref:Uncharacterized protein n=1 Tax=Paracoccus acridae TaxID=1795310 RepID=A0ABQ1VPC9_9RHOB|nr:hypothetical protein [Paracoccus acridae]GGF81495.1 hypothetical protein GCM10011402_37630 [Paracoccus acridae]
MIDTQGERIEILTAKFEETRTAAILAAGRTDHRAYAKLMR